MVTQKLLAFESFFQSLSMNVIGSLFDIEGRSLMFTINVYQEQGTGGTPDMTAAK